LQCLKDAQVEHGVGTILRPCLLVDRANTSEIRTSALEQRTDAAAAALTQRADQHAQQLDAIAVAASTAGGATLA
jgi:hypothetical protein